MAFTTLISTTELSNHLNDPDWLIVDCSFQLGNQAEKESAYQKAHIPGALYAHLHRDLSGMILPGKTGRHPFPTVDEAAQFFSKIGIDRQVQVVAYDDQGGALAAARLWIMLNWLGHEKAAILDGGLPKWVQEGRPLSSGPEIRQPRDFVAVVQPQWLANADEVDQLRQAPECRVIDVRAPERYRGEIEPIDPVAGHIPGSVNIPYQQNFTGNGILKSSEDLRSFYQEKLGDVQMQDIVLYCGSGVTCAFSALALKHSGLGSARIYPGSWSEWITSDAHPRAVGP